MKARYILLLIVGALLAPVWFTSCGEDRWQAYEEQTKTATWINDTMRVWYYWRDEMPEAGKLNYFQAPFTFFKNLLSKSDKFSYIDSLNSSVTTRSIPYTDYSYGFQFAMHGIADNDTAYFAHILYVAEGSPASEAGLKRGDWLLQMNGELITKKNYARLFGAPAMQMLRGHYDATTGKIQADNAPLTLPAARRIEDDPIHYSTVFESGDKRIGYLVYNHFSAGTDDNPQKYNDRLRALFREFAARRVNEFILDLRYNNGGLISCAQLLCSMLAPASALGGPLCYIEYDPNREGTASAISFLSSVVEEGCNLNLSRLYVLTSDQTASASEMVVNCLRPHMEVTLVGNTTVGKNVGSIAFENQELMITMSPIVCKIYNSEMRSDYGNGFTPDYRINEDSNMDTFLDFGNPSETLLGTALGCIVGEPEADQPLTRSTSIGKVITTSVSRKADNGVRLR